MTSKNNSQIIKDIGRSVERKNKESAQLRVPTVFLGITICAFASFEALFVSSICTPAFAEGHCHVHWDKLGLSPAQSQRIQEIEEAWQKQYSETAPAIADEQQRLSKKLGEHCDQLEIISLHNSIDRKQIQLRQLAMMTFLKKRAVLNDSQQRSLEVMMNSEIAKRQAELNPGSSQSEMPSGFQDLLTRVRNVFPTAADRQ
jgi:Spy/CpxP family protein refolding chaperone